MLRNHTNNISYKFHYEIERSGDKRNRKLEEGEEEFKKYVKYGGYDLHTIIVPRLKYESFGWCGEVGPAIRGIATSFQLFDPILMTGRNINTEALLW